MSPEAEASTGTHTESGMIPRECIRLAEVDFPIAVAPKHAAREMSIRHGHPSTLHLWWARRPLASSRAVLLALLLPDPLRRALPGGLQGTSAGDPACGTAAAWPRTRPTWTSDGTLCRRPTERRRGSWIRSPAGARFHRRRCAWDLGEAVAVSESTGSSAVADWLEHDVGGGQTRCRACSPEHPARGGRHGSRTATTVRRNRRNPRDSEEKRLVDAMLPAAPSR